MDKKAVILLSGGLDSATTAAIARAQGFSLYALSVDYGQRHKHELEAARRVAAALGVVRHVVVVVDLAAIGGSALTDQINVPKDRDDDTMRRERDCPNFRGHHPGTAAERRSPMPGENGTVPLDTRTVPSNAEFRTVPPEIPITYVPARNTMLLSLALGYAEVVGAADVFIGVNAVDYSGYPDCRPEFLRAFSDLANLATKAGVEGTLKFRIHAPLLHLSKAEIIRRGVELGVDYSLTHSCYDPDQRGRACGRCDACRLRLAGFAEAGLQDTAAYQTCETHAAGPHFRKADRCLHKRP